MNKHSRGSPAPARLYFHSRGPPATFASIPIPVQVSPPNRVPGDE